MSDGRVQREFSSLILARNGGAPALPSASEMRAFDARTIAQGTASLQLMERAGTVVAEAVSAILTETGQKRVVVLCGPGNNGGDGAVVARHLRRRRVAVQCIVAGAGKLSPDLIVNLRHLSEARCSIDAVGATDALDQNGIKYLELQETEIPQRLAQADIVVDALLGTGQHEAPRGVIAVLIDALTKFRAKTLLKVISVDCPSGIDTDTGETFEPHVRADSTIALEYVKRGMLQYPAREACGVIVTKSIGIEGQACEYDLLCRDTLTIPRREADAHKGDCGKVLIIAGSASMPGAAALAACGALRSGAGLVSRALPQGSSAPFQPPEIINRIVAGNGGEFGPESFEALRGALAAVDSAVLGPGIDSTPASRRFCEYCLEYFAATQAAVVLDAEALNVLSLILEQRTIALARAVLTPHPGEMSRLLRTSIAEVQRDRYAAARLLHERTGATVVLKGASTVIYSAKNRGTVNILGNAFMATAGSGDVLSGAIATFLAQRLSAFEAAKLAVYLHSRAGDLAHDDSGGPITASDIARYLPRALGELCAVVKAL